MEATGCIYHEKQYGSMCGQHCLNNLLQAPYFQPEDLAEIARELDEAEKSLLTDTGAGGGDSHNVDDSGNFSIQVLSTALERSHSLKLVQDSRVLNELLEELNREDVTLEGTEVAFVCNLASHWFAIRSIHGEFWDLNSVRKRPKKISLFYLSAYLGQLREEGYSIFVVRGTLPPPMQDMNIGRREDWFVIGVDDATEEPQRESIHADNLYEDEQLQQALRESMRSQGSAGNDENELQRALAMSMGTHAQNDGEDDEDLRLALEMSLKER